MDLNFKELIEFITALITLVTLLLKYIFRENEIKKSKIAKEIKYYENMINIYDEYDGYRGMVCDHKEIYKILTSNINTAPIFIKDSLIDCKRLFENNEEIFIKSHSAYCKDHGGYRQQERYEYFDKYYNSIRNEFDNMIINIYYKIEKRKKDLEKKLNS